MEELFELCEATMETTDESFEVLEDALVDIKKTVERGVTDEEIIADQQDALVDIIYCTMNVACKSGVNMEPIFDQVHRANMLKVDQETGKVKRREDGKIMKPEGWAPPDIVEEIRKQLH